MSTSSKQIPGLTVRRIKEEDIASVFEIDSKNTGKNRALTYATIPYSYVGGEMDISMVAEVDKQVVGFLFGKLADSHQGTADIAFMQLMGVDPAYHHRGIGTALIRGFIDRCQQKGVKSVHSFASSQDQWMLSFLNSLGFVRGDMTEFIKPIEY